MKRGNYQWCLFALILIINISCDNSDPVPDAGNAETIITIGNTEDLSVLSLNTELELLSADHDSLTLEVDINGDETIDLTVLSYKLDEQIQLLLIQSADDLEIPFSSASFTVSNTTFNYLSLVEEGVKMKKDHLNWTSNQQLLLAYRGKNQYTTPNPNPMNNDVYLPIYDGEKLGWITFSISADISLEAISIKEYVYAELD